MPRSAALLVDFGSTFTKLTAVDLDKGELIGASQSPTTIREGIMAGLSRALELLDCPESKGGVGDPGAWSLKLACSSAAGGLRMVALGLVPELTVEAAKRAALGAGAKVLAAYSHEITLDETREIESLKPDIVLLAGGTDGGNKKVLLANAEALAASDLGAPFLIAGNKVAAPAAKRILAAGGKDVRLCQNVMPELGTINVDPVRSAIREVFIEHIVKAKGLDEAIGFVDGGILMPTPAAVLDAAKLLSEGIGGESGFGELMVVDVGGATTDVHSVAEGKPTASNVTVRGLPEPFAKRTVEGDLGVRHSAAALAEAVGLAFLADHAGMPVDRIGDMAKRLPDMAGILPADAEWQSLDTALAAGAVDMAVSRHVGTVSEVFTPFGATYVQRGKDLTGIDCLIGSGGPVIRSPQPLEILSGALFRDGEPGLLRPKNPRLLLDSGYILSAMGLLAGIYPEQAFQILKSNLINPHTRGAVGAEP